MTFSTLPGYHYLVVLSKISTFIPSLSILMSIISSSGTISKVIVGAATSPFLVLDIIPFLFSASKLTNPFYILTIKFPPSGKRDPAWKAEIQIPESSEYLELPYIFVESISLTQLSKQDTKNESPILTFFLAIISLLLRVSIHPRVIFPAGSSRTTGSSSVQGIPKISKAPPLLIVPYTSVISNLT